MRQSQYLYLLNYILFPLPYNWPTWAQEKQYDKKNKLKLCTNQRQEPPYWATFSWQPICVAIFRPHLLLCYLQNMYVSPSYFLKVNYIKSEYYLWDMRPCWHVGDYQCSSETTVNFYQIIRCHVPEDSTLRTHHSDSLKSYMVKLLITASSITTFLSYKENLP